MRIYEFLSQNQQVLTLTISPTALQKSVFFYDLKKVQYSSEFASPKKFVISKIASLHLLPLNKNHSFLRPLKNIVFIGLLEGLKIFYLKIVLSTT